MIWGEICFNITIYILLNPIIQKQDFYFFFLLRCCPVIMNFQPVRYILRHVKCPVKFSPLYLTALTIETGSGLGGLPCVSDALW